jgi:transposase-like protein
MSTHEIHRVLGVTYKTAWFMTMRLREAMRDGTLPMLGGEGETAEIDETYVGGKERNKHAAKRKHEGRGGKGKEPVFALVECEGKVRSFHVAEVNGATLREIVQAQLHGDTVVYSDENHTTRYSVKGYKTETVNHSIGEYVRGDAHTNTIESYFATLKRGIIGTYHHVSQQHLKRYLAEFDFRYNERSALGVEDVERATKALRGIVGKRLTYRQPNA